MRRIYAFVLILLCVSQSMAAAAPTSSLQIYAEPVSAQIADAFRPTLASVEQTWAFAAASGRLDRYAAMHAPKPEFERDGPLVARRTRLDTPLESGAFAATLGTTRFAQPREKATALGRVRTMAL
jgi:hypothetical protein